MAPVRTALGAFALGGVAGIAAVVLAFAERWLAVGALTAVCVLLVAVATALLRRADPAELALRRDGFLLLLRLVDDLLRDVRRHFLVAHEVHPVVAAAAGERRQRLRVRED